MSGNNDRQVLPNNLKALRRQRASVGNSFDPRNGPLQYFCVIKKCVLFRVCLQSNRCIYIINVVLILIDDQNSNFSF